VSPILGIWASQNYSRYSLPTSYESIATSTVGSGGTATVTFSSIPSGYTHLQIRMSALSTGTTSTPDDWKFNFNNDSGSNYASHGLYGNGSTVSVSTARTSFTSIRFTGFDRGITNGITVGVIDILDYANSSKYKTLRGLVGFDNNSSTYPGAVALGSGVWMNTTAINRIDITNSLGNFNQYSHFALYGIKGE
jgi:hypothetical protein